MKAKSEADAKVEYLEESHGKMQQAMELLEGDQRAFKIVKDKLGRVWLPLKSSFIWLRLYVFVGIARRGG